MIGYLALLTVYTTAIWIPLYRIFTAEDRRARLRAPKPIDNAVPLLLSHSNQGLV